MLQTRFFYCLQDITDQIKNLIQSVLDSQQVELVDLMYRWESGREVLRLLIDKTGGVSLDDCTRVNKAVSDILDNMDLIKQSFVLEVNSPGLDRPLVTKKDFQKNIGKAVKLIVKNAKGTTDTITAELTGVDDDKIILNGETQILFADIIKAKLEIQI